MRQAAPIIDEHRFRRQHDPVERVVDEFGNLIQIADSDGAIGSPHRIVPLLVRWERAGRITAEMRAAGEKFHELFHLAHLDPLCAADMSRPGGCGASSTHRGSVAAQDAVRGCMTALGGMGTPIGCCAWFVLGCEHSLRQWAIREGWKDRPLHHTTATATLIGALDVLRIHFEG